MYRCLIVIIFLLAYDAVSSTDAATVTGVSIVEYGVYAIKPTSPSVNQPETATGYVTPIYDAILITKTNYVPAVLNTTFGCRFVIEGSPVNALVETTIVVVHPKFAKRGSRENMPDRVPWTYSMGKVVGYMYRLDYPWECEPGEWSIQIWWNGRMFAEQKFTLFEVYSEEHLETTDHGGSADNRGIHLNNPGTRE